MQANDLVLVTRAIELLHYGVDITQLDSLSQYYNPKTKSLQSRISDNIEDFCVKYEPTVMAYIEYYLGEYVVRHGSSFIEIFENSLTDEEKALKRIEVGLKEFKQVMSVLKEKGFANFTGFNQADYDEEYQKKIDDIRKNFDYSKKPDCDMVAALIKNKMRQNLEVMIQLCNYPTEVAEGMLEAYDREEKDFGLENLSRYPIIDNRMYIKLASVDKDALKQVFANNDWMFPKDLEDLEYIVISRNVYDFFFCSYGSNIQSCYSLNSTHYGWYGFVPLSQFDGTYVVYGTSGKPNKINMISGTKWAVPRMLYRSWGWKGTDNKLYLDRVYIGNDAPENKRNAINKWFESIFLQYGIDFTHSSDISLVSSDKYKEYFKKYSLKCYPDSINFYRDDGTCHYRGVCKGDRNFVGGRLHLPSPLLDRLRNITEIAPNFHYCDKWNIINGRLQAVKVCPITKLPIDEDAEQSEFANMFTEPVNNVAVVTFIDGMFHLDTASKDSFSNEGISYTTEANECGTSSREGSSYIFTPRWNMPFKRVAIKTFKETLKEAMTRSKQMDAVIVRFVEGNKVTYVKYRR